MSLPRHDRNVGEHVPETAAQQSFCFFVRNRYYLAWRLHPYLSVPEGGETGLDHLRADVSQGLPDPIHNARVCRSHEEHLGMILSWVIGDLDRRVGGLEVTPTIGDELKGCVFQDRSDRRRPNAPSSSVRSTNFHSTRATLRPCRPHRTSHERPYGVAEPRPSLLVGTDELVVVGEAEQPADLGDREPAAAVVVVERAGLDAALQVAGVVVAEGSRPAGSSSPATSGVIAVRDGSPRLQSLRVCVGFERSAP
jgi:hypothetical protein